MSDVCVVGALHLDVVVDAPRLPALDETLFGSAVAYRFGGKGGNQALAAARMGASVAMAGRVGQDAFAETVLDALRVSGVDHSQVRQVPGATGISVAIVETGGEYGAVVVSGVNQTIDADEVALGGAKVILLQNEIPEAVNLAVARHKPASSTLILNAAPARSATPKLLDAVDVLVVNRVEAAQITGNAPSDLARSVKALAAFGPRHVILTAGAEGAVVSTNGVVHNVAPPLRAVGSTHGAGDAFVGALAAELAQRADLIDAVRFASTAAAYFVHTTPEDRQSITRAAALEWASKL